MVLTVHLDMFLFVIMVVVLVVDVHRDLFFDVFFFGITGIDDGGSGMFVDIGQDVVLVIDDDEDDDGDTGEPPALLPFSQFVLADTNVDDGRRTIP